MGRFISADEPAYLGANGTITSYNPYAYCCNDPMNNADPYGKWTVGFSVGANANFIIGISFSIGLFFDGKGNIDPQWSFAIPGKENTLSVGLLDAGLGLSFQYTNIETVYDLYGSAVYYGLSAGTGLYGGVDVICIPDTNDLRTKVKGIQLTAGLGLGVDAHMVISKTKPLISNATPYTGSLNGINHGIVAMTM